MNNTSNDLTLQAVQQQFQAWRDNRDSKRERIPQHLWEAAVALCREHTVYHVCKNLRLSYRDLKKRLPDDNTPTCFMPINFHTLAGQWQIECSRADGSMLRLSGTGQAPEIQTILKSFFA